MKIVKNPNRTTWQELCRRPEMSADQIDPIVEDILNKVKSEGDKAVLEITRKFDSPGLTELTVSAEEIKSAKDEVPQQLQEAIQIAYSNIKAFHKTQLSGSEKVETFPGVTCWRKSVGIQKVGLYIPGGSAPLFSTVLMLGIPAQIAGCEEVVLCTPPNKEGKIHPAILYAAQLAGITQVYKVGGAQAIAAMAFGTESIPQVFKIFGPGNQFVTRAKMKINALGIAIDMPAGPSEVAVFADATARPEFIASDLLSQAEHGPDSQVVLVATDSEILDKTIAATQEQLNALPRKEIAEKAISNSVALLIDDKSTAFDFLNLYAPEHLIIASDNAFSLADAVINAGSVFLGHYTPESAGDYASGTNHTLPTNGFATAYSGVSLDSYMKKITFQNITQEGINLLGPAIETMAEAEGLTAHKNAATLRMK